MKEIRLPRDVKTIINRINDSGHEAYVVGGCVRDALFGLTPHDYDITTDCSPQETEDLFSDFKVIETGIKHGTVTVIVNHVPYEITTYRKDADYSDHRHPDQVIFTDRIIDDLSRRDFTINAMAYNDLEGLIDPFNGEQDLNEGIIRCVGDPEKRFEEDALRILRCLRFSSRFDFRIDEKTETALFKKKDLLKYVSVERIAVEFNQIICSRFSEKYLNQYRDIFETAIPHLKDACFDLLDSLNSDLKIRISALFFRNENASGMCEDMLRSLHYPNEILKDVLEVLNHKNARMLTRNDLILLLTEISQENAERLIALRELIFNEEHRDIYDDLNNISAGIISRRDLAVSGDDLKEIGLTGKNIGKWLDDAYKKVITGLLVNDKELLIKYIKREMNR